LPLTTSPPSSSPHPPSRAIMAWVKSMGRQILAGNLNLVNTSFPVLMFEPRSYLQKLADVWVYPGALARGRGFGEVLCCLFHAPLSPAPHSTPPPSQTTQCNIPPPPQKKQNKTQSTSMQRRRRPTLWSA
jgi:hypothetical protein